MGSNEIDLVQYEIFRHRLFNILEEGRIAIRQVSGSPVVVEGGETLCSFYTPSGDAILTGSGILLHCTGAADFVKATIDWYCEDPGIFEGDQFLWNDPYIGGQHNMDNIIVKPIFYEAKIVAWVGSFMHTPEVGAIDPGGTCPSAKEIFHEGFRVAGLKIMDRGIFKKEIFTTICRATRDPHLIGLDTKAKIAANNVCSRYYLELIDKHGLTFVEKAGQRLIEEAEIGARDRLAQLPDGAWSTQLISDTNGFEQVPFKVACTMTKKGDSVSFDFTGSSPQNAGSVNCTKTATLGALFAALTNQLFWGLPANCGLIRPVELIAPEGTVVNCSYPAACSQSAATVGLMVTESAHGCITEMFYAAGEKFWDDATSAYGGGCAHPFFGGVNQYGELFGATVLDVFAAGMGATPKRDGVDTGGLTLAPSSAISDVEIIELGIPAIYLLRQHSRDSYGFGKFRGGLGAEAAYMIHGSSRVRIGVYGHGAASAVSFGLFGGYPAAEQRNLAMLGSNLPELFKRGSCPMTFEEFEKLDGKKIEMPSNCAAFPVKEYDVVINRWSAGGGFGDPLERDPELVARDIENFNTSSAAAADIYGVVLNAATLRIDVEATKELRDRLRKARIEEVRSEWAGSEKIIKEGWRIHEYLEIREIDGDHKGIVCRVCDYVICAAGQNYKGHCASRRLSPRDYLPGRLTEVDFQVHREFYCPSCGTLLQVDGMAKDDAAPLWDMRPHI